MNIKSPETEVIRETKSVCPKCLGSINAYFLEREGVVYLKKSCDAHGESEIEISRNPSDYRSLSKSYFFYMKRPHPPAEYYICATTGCNADCPICFLKQCPSASALSLEDIRHIAVNNNVQRFTFSHGEATICPDLPEMIRILKRSGKTVNIHTNGIKMADLDYASLLRRVGIDQISLQFDSFCKESSSCLRGSGISAIQLRALENLKRLKIPVTLNVTIAKGVNDEEMGRIFDYAIKERSIKDLSFITYCHYDDKNTDFLNKYIMPDRLINNLEKYSEGRIARKDIILFQKLFYAYMSIAKIRKCFNYFHYIVVRDGDAYYPINYFINLSKASSMLGAAEKRGRILGFWEFVLVLIASLKPRSLLLIPYSFIFLFRRRFLQESGKFLAITLATICDPYKYDADVAANCGQGIVIDGKVHDSYGVYLMEAMKIKRQTL